jgi:hypothetical protein
MKKLLVRASMLSATIAATLATAAPAFAQQGSEPSGGTDVSTTVIWSLIGVGIFSLALGILYLLKRHVGGFPEDPSWVAPISIQRASELPSEDAHGHDDHGDSHGHAPAH